MRYYNQEDVPFTIDFRTVLLKEHIPYSPPTMTNVRISTNKESSFDEIVSRIQIYGEGMEAESYKVFDENIKELFEARFNMDIIQSVRVP